MARHDEEWVTILATRSGYACILDQIKYDGGYKKLYFPGGPPEPLSGHYTRMRDKWPTWTFIDREEWEHRFGKVKYP